MANCDVWSYKSEFKDSKGKPRSYCGKKAKAFFRVRYSHISVRKLDGRDSDLIGLCDECAKSMQKNLLGMYQRTDSEGSHLRSARGPISHMERVEASEEELQLLERQARRRVTVDHMKATFVRHMLQENRQDVTDEEWTEAFETALREAKAHQVMKE